MHYDKLSNNMITFVKTVVKVR